MKYRFVHYFVHKTDFYTQNHTQIVRREKMAQKKQTISTPHGLAYISKRGKYNSYYLKLNDPKLSTKDRTIRKTLKHIPKETYQEYISNQVAEIYDEIKNHKPKQMTNPIRFIKEVYYPYMDQMTDRGAPLPSKGKWNKIKTKNDRKVIEKYLIPFISENDLEWKDLIDDLVNIRFVDYMRLKGNIEDTTITKYKGLFNIMFRLARQHKLIDRFPTYPKLDNGSKRYLGMKVRGKARATDQMIRTLLEVAENEINRSYRGKSPKTDWDRTITYHWLNLVIDTGIRPFPNIPFFFSAISDDGDGIKFYRNEKIRGEYVARGGPRAKRSITALKEMYLAQGFKPIHVLSDIHGDKHRTIDRHTRILLAKSGWKDMRDEGGRKYDPHSIRKWHINHAIELGELKENIADRVGHSLATLIAEYEDQSFIPSTRPKNFDSVLQTKENVSYLTG